MYVFRIDSLVYEKIVEGSKNRVERNIDISLWCDCNLRQKYQFTADKIIYKW
jgi:hypothetical protein